jgi:hypothetical protein
VKIDANEITEKFSILESSNESHAVSLSAALSIQWQNEALNLMHCRMNI